MIQFSVCLPVRNGWPYIQECVESILRQTYPNFELQVFDNNSTDNTVPWLNSLNDPRIRIWPSPTSLSIVENWKRIIDIKKLEFMTIVGHDDIFDAGFLSSIKNLIDLYPDAGLYATEGRFINSRGNIIRSLKPRSRFETSEEYLTKRFKYQCDISSTGYVMRSADYDRIGGIPPFEKLFFADDALWLSLMQGKYTVTCPEEHFSIRLHPDSESASLPSTWPSILLGLRQFNEFLQNQNRIDASLSSVIEKYAANFMLAYHRNAYILALVAAAQTGERISPETEELFNSSLAACAPTVKRSLLCSMKVAFLRALSQSPLRVSIPWLWKVYHQLKNKNA